MTHNPIRPWRNIDRRVSRQIRVGKVLVGGDAPISVQTMTNTLTTDIKATIEQIQRRVAEHFDIRLADMTSKRRPANIAFPRQIAMYLSRELTRSSLSEIGEAFGGRDHGTVLHAHRQVVDKMTKDERTRHVVSFLDNQLQR